MSELSLSKKFYDEYLAVDDDWVGMGWSEAYEIYEGMRRLEQTIATQAAEIELAHKWLDRVVGKQVGGSLIERMSLVSANKVKRAAMLAALEGESDE